MATHTQPYVLMLRAIIAMLCALAISACYKPATRPASPPREAVPSPPPPAQPGWSDNGNSGGSSSGGYAYEGGSSGGLPVVIGSSGGPGPRRTIARTRARPNAPPVSSSVAEPRRIPAARATYSAQASVPDRSIIQPQPPLVASEGELTWPLPVTVGRKHVFLYSFTPKSLGSQPSRSADEGGSGIMDIQSSRYMEVTLEGGNFTITPIGETRKDLGTSQTGNWRWHVTPLKPGKHDIVVSISNFAVDANGEQTPVLIGTPLRKPVTVSTEPWTTSSVLSAMTSTTGSITALIAALTALLAAIIKFRKQLSDLLPRNGRTLTK